MNILPSFFFVGYLPAAPGTWASLIAALIAWYFPNVLWVGSFVLFLIGFYTTRLYLVQNPGRKDPAEVVIDEVVGQWVALLIAPHSLSWFMAAFSLFRLFDIWKPFPVSWIDRLGKREKTSYTLQSFSVMMDDVVAGLMVLGVLQVAQILL